MHTYAPEKILAPPPLFLSSRNHSNDSHIMRAHTHTWCLKRNMSTMILLYSVSNRTTRSTLTSRAPTRKFSGSGTCSGRSAGRTWRFSCSTSRGHRRYTHTYIYTEYITCVLCSAELLCVLFSLGYHCFACLFFAATAAAQGWWADSTGLSFRAFLLLWVLGRPGGVSLILPICLKC